MKIQRALRNQQTDGRKRAEMDQRQPWPKSEPIPASNPEKKSEPQNEKQTIFRSEPFEKRNRQLQASHLYQNG